MVYPKYKNKHLEEALFNVNEFFKYGKKNKGEYPSKYILLFHPSVLKYFKRKFKGQYKKIKFDFRHDLYIMKKYDLGIVSTGGIGSPYAAVILEQLIGLGGKKFIAIGDAGGLQTDGFFLCEKALRDEGTSYHYIPHGHYSYPDEKLTNKLGKSMENLGLKYYKKPTWTTDAFFRETKAEIQKYKKQGIATVEMEAAAMFAVATVRKVKMASAFVVSDVLGEKWVPHYKKRTFKIMRNKLIDVAIGCLK